MLYSDCPLLTLLVIGYMLTLPLLCDFPESVTEFVNFDITLPLDIVESNYSRSIELLSLLWVT